MTTPRALPVACSLILLSLPAFGQDREPFPVPFTVEHHVVDGTLGGPPIEGETVKDTYGGSFLVSQRGDSSRTIVDFARREVTEVRTDRGTYWTMSFGRWAELRRRLETAESDGVAAKAATLSGAVKRAVRVEEIRDLVTRGSRTPAGATRSGLKRLRASVEGGPALEAWIDPAAPRLTAAGAAALADFERTVLGTGDGSVGAAELLDAIRSREGGALVVRTRRTVGTEPAAGAEGLVIEDVVTKAEPVASLPPALVSVPEGLRRVPSPLEVVVSWAEDEAALRQRGRR